MSVFWLILGLIIGGGLVFLWSSKSGSYGLLDWSLIGIGVVLWVMTIAFIVSVLQEVFPGSTRAAGIGGMFLGLIAVIYSVLIYRRRLSLQ